MSSRVRDGSILLLSEKRDFATDLVVLELEARGCQYFRLNFDELGECWWILWSSNSDSSFILGDVEIPLRSISSSWFRHFPRFWALEEVPLYARDFTIKERLASLIGWCRASECTWVNSPLAVLEAENKIWQLSVANNLGLAVPQTLVTNSYEKARAFCRRFPTVAKGVAGGGFVKNGVLYRVFTNAMDERDLPSTTAKAVGVSPITLQRQLQKKRDIRVTIVGRHVFAAELELPENTAGIDWRTSRDFICRRHALPSALAEHCLAVTHSLGLVYGAIDLVLTKDDEYFFLEVNPGGQWGWVERQTDFPITSTIARILSLSDG